MVRWLIGTTVRPRAQAIALLGLITLPSPSAAQAPPEPVACATASACVAQARTALVGGGGRRGESFSSLLKRVARPCDTEGFFGQTCEAARSRIRTAQALLEQACELGARQACEGAVEAAVTPMFEAATCGQAEVCYRLGLESCRPPCSEREGTEVNIGMAVHAHEQGCRLGSPQSCRSLLEFLERGFGTMLKQLGGDPTKLACGRASQAGDVRVPQGRPSLAELCLRGAEYCGTEGFFLPCEGLAHQRAQGRVSDAEWSAVRRSLESSCAHAGDGGSGALGGAFACEATRRLSLPEAVHPLGVRGQPRRGVTRRRSGPTSPR